MDMREELAAFKALQTDIQKCLQQQQTLVSQENENQAVLEELQRLDDDAEVYKLIGPAVIKQDLVEARSNVNKRLAYIRGELGRLETQLKDLDTRSRNKQATLMKMQQGLAQGA